METSPSNTPAPSSPAPLPPDGRRPLDDFILWARPWMKVIVIVTAVGLLGMATVQVLPLLKLALNVLSPFLVGLVLAYVFHPIVTFVQRKLHLGRVTGILVLALVILAVLGGLLIWLIPELYRQLADALRNISGNIRGIIDRLAAQHLDPATREQIATRLEALIGNIDSSIQSIVGQVGGALQPVATGGATAVRNVASGVLSAIGNVAAAMASFGFVLVITFYYLADMDQIPGVIRRLLPSQHRERIWDLAQKSDRAVGGFLRGQLTACICIGILTTFLLFVIGMKEYALLIGSFAGLMNFIPYLGPIAGATPAVLWVLMTPDMADWGTRGMNLLYIAGGFAAIQMIDGLIFQPFIVGKNASLHPLAVMLALAIGAQAGIGGMILAVPIACMVRILWLELFWSKRALPDETTSNDPLAPAITPPPKTNAPPTQATE